LFRLVFFSTCPHSPTGGGAGLIAAALTNPLDVVKTRLQTQGDTGLFYGGMVNAFSTIWRTEGLHGYSYLFLSRFVLCYCLFTIFICEPSSCLKA
jgi:hypothetical protein